MCLDHIIILDQHTGNPRRIVFDTQRSGLINRPFSFTFIFIFYYTTGKLTRSTAVYSSKFELNKIINLKKIGKIRKQGVN